MILNNWMILANKCNPVPSSLHSVYGDERLILETYGTLGLVPIFGTASQYFGTNTPEDGYGLTSFMEMAVGYSYYSTLTPCALIGDTRVQSSTSLSVNFMNNVPTLDTYGLSDENSQSPSGQAYGFGIMINANERGASSALKSLYTNYMNPFGALALEISDQSGDISASDYDLEHNITESYEIGNVQNLVSYTFVPGGNPKVSFYLQNSGATELTIRQVGLSKAGLIVLLKAGEQASAFAPSIKTYGSRDYFYMTTARGRSYGYAHGWRLLLSKYNLTNPITLQPGQGCTITFDLTFFDPNAPVITNL